MHVQARDFRRATALTSPHHQCTPCSSWSADIRSKIKQLQSGLLGDATGVRRNELRLADVGLDRDHVAVGFHGRCRSLDYGPVALNGLFREFSRGDNHSNYGPASNQVRGRFLAGPDAILVVFGRAPFLLTAIRTSTFSASSPAAPGTCLRSRVRSPSRIADRTR